MKKIITCPVCLSVKTHSVLKAFATHGSIKLGTKETFLYYLCTNCHVIFLTGVSFSKNFYQRYYTFPEVTKKSGLKEKIEIALNRNSTRKKTALIEELAEQHKEKIDLLDVGCGDGSFLASLNKSKFNAYGIELNDKDYKKSKQKNLAVYHEDIIKKNFNGKKFHVITLWHVVEHIPDPHRLFKKLKSLLTSEGIVILSTPNIDSLGFMYAKEKWFHLDAPRHVIIYSKKGMEKLSLLNGFHTKKILSQTFEFPLDLFWSIKQTKRSYLMYPLYPLMKHLSKETLTFVLTKSYEK